MDNKEDYLDALTAFSKNPTPEIPHILEQYLNGVAKNGETLFHWPLLKPLIVSKMEQVIAELRKGLSAENIPTRPNVENVQFDVMHKRIMDSIHKFNGAPFTIQRLCELLIDPKQHYKRSDKFLRGLERNVLVVSTVDPYGRKVVADSGNKHLVNGMDLNGSPFFPRDSNISSTLPPVPGWVTSSVTVSPRVTTTNNIAATTEEAKQLQPSSQETSVTTNGVVGGLVSSLYSENGEQPLGVQTEEVVEETVVTMETSDVGPVATDGGEALADDEEEEEMGAEDTNASSSSSSSSSEELSTSDSGESAAVQSTQTSTVTHDPSIRPWASIANEGENSKDALPQQPETDAVETVSKTITDVTPEQQSPTTQSTDQVVVGDAEVGRHSDILDHSFGFDTTLESRPVEVVQQSDSSASTPADVIESSIEADSPSSSCTSSSSLPFSHLRTYADVVSGSQKELTSEKMDVPDSACDSVTVLERLVDSVDMPPTQTSNTQPASDPMESDEPKPKRFKSDSDMSDVDNHQVSSSPSENVTEETPDLNKNATGSETSDCVMTETSECSQETTVEEESCHSEADPSPSQLPSDQLSRSSQEQACDDTVSHDTSSPPSQLSSSSDSQGFDMCREERKSMETPDESSLVTTTESMEHE
ncbi:serine/threonine-protein phosphatase 4 regulatory subunit 2 [Biomphalaria glabrata]|nr:serine/threonine-protein phosphatase 4 regulatory subunit 2 [Biomphalaria glabrata]